MSYYPHNTFTYCSSANKLGYNVKDAYSKLVEEFKKGHVTYPRTDSYGHMPIRVLSDNINKKVKTILMNEPVYKETDNFYIGDVYTLSGALYLSSPASLIEDVEKAKKITPPKKVDIYIGLRRKEFIESEALFIETKRANKKLLKDIFEKDYKRSKNKIPAFNKNKETVTLQIA